MATVTFRIPDDLKAEMESHKEINWSAILRDHVEEQLGELSDRHVAHAVATSERLSADIDPDEVGEADTTEVIREFRDSRRAGSSD